MLYNNDDISYKNEDLHFNDLSTDFNLTREQFDQLGITVYSYEEFNAFGNLKNISYDDFVSRFEVYPTYGTAKYRIKLLKKKNPSVNLYAHHLKDLSVQIKEYNSNHNTSYNRREFEKYCKDSIDGRCIVVTFVEHFLVHYLAAKDLGKDYKITFYTFLRMSTFSEQENIIRQLIDKNEINAINKLQTQHIFKNKHAFTDGKITVYRDECPEGFVPGTAFKFTYDRENPKHWWTNGEINLYQSNKPEGEGWTNGLNKRESHWYTNGIEDVFLVECPEGYWLGNTFPHKKTGERKYNSKEERLLAFSQQNKERYQNMTPEEKAELSRKRKEAANRPEVKESISKTLTGVVYWNNGVVEIRQREKPEGNEWKRGRLKSLNVCVSLKGTHYWNDGIKEIRSKECPGEGFIRGRLPERKLDPYINKGKVSYTDGSKNIFLGPNDKIPEGFWKGQVR